MAHRLHLLPPLVTSNAAAIVWFRAETDRSKLIAQGLERRRQEAERIWKTGRAAVARPKQATSAAA